MVFTIDFNTFKDARFWSLTADCSMELEQKTSSFLPCFCSDLRNSQMMPMTSDVKTLRTITVQYNVKLGNNNLSVSNNFKKSCQVESFVLAARSCHLFKVIFSSDSVFLSRFRPSEVQETQE